MSHTKLALVVAFSLAVAAPVALAGEAQDHAREVHQLGGPSTGTSPFRDQMRKDMRKLRELKKLREAEERAREDADTEEDLSTDSDDKGVDGIE